MRTERWCLCFSLPDGRPSVVLYATAITNTRPIGGLLFTLAEFSEPEQGQAANLELAQADPSIVVFGALNMPATRAPSSLLAWLGNRGLTYQATQGDTVLNLVRAIRDQFLKAGARIRVDELR